MIENQNSSALRSYSITMGENYSAKSTIDQKKVITKIRALHTALHSMTGDKEKIAQQIGFHSSAPRQGHAAHYKY